MNRAMLNLDRSDSLSDQAAVQYSLNDSAQWLAGTLNNNNYRVFNFNSGNDALTVDYLTDNVGIGTPSPTAKLEVNGQIKITGGGPGQGKVLISDAAGLASWGEDNPKKGFSAYSSSGTLAIASAVETPVLFDTENFNDGAYYNSALGQYQAGSEGMYHFDVKVNWNTLSATGEIILALRLNGIITEQVRQGIQPGLSSTQQVLNANLKLYAGDVIDIVVLQNTGLSQSLNLNSLDSGFEGFKVY
jgi:hypothetical protein